MRVRHGCQGLKPVAIDLSPVGAINDSGGEQLGIDNSRSRGRLGWELASRVLARRSGFLVRASTSKASMTFVLRSEGEDLDWMWESYRDFRAAFRLAINDGLVVFY